MRRQESPDPTPRTARADSADIEGEPQHTRAWDKHARALAEDDFSAAHDDAPREEHGFREWNPNVADSEPDPADKRSRRVSRPRS